MPGLRNTDEEPTPQSVNDTETPEGDEDTEGHMFQLDPSTARDLARTRSADVDRELRERQRQKEARPNRR